MFSNLQPRQLVDENETPIGALTHRFRSPGGLREKILAFEKQIDKVIDEASFAGTPVIGGFPWTPVVVSQRGVTSRGNDGLSARVLAAVEEVRATLDLSEQRTAQLLGIARNTLASWRREERAPYPATVRTLFEIHSIVAAANALFGLVDARQWFSIPGESGIARKELLYQSAGSRLVMNELRHAMFPGAGTRTLPSSEEFEEGEIPNGMVPGYDQDAFAGPIQRRRNIP
jgi:transcriptional regulator with XRE-family HTH domain